MKRVSVFQMFWLNAYWIGMSFMWNSLHPIVLPALLLNFVPDSRKNTVLGLLTFVGLIIAMVIQPISGALSDRWASRWGRRRPLILAGTLFDLVFLALLGWSGGLMWIAIGYLGLQFSSNIAHGPMQGLMPDRVPHSQLGAASGIKNMIDMGGLVVASLVAGRLLDPQARYPTTIMAVIMALLVLSMLVTLIFTPEEPTQRVKSQPRPKPLADLLKIDWRGNASFWWLIASRLAFLISAYGVQSFIQYYLQDVLKVANPAVETGNLLAVVTLTLIAVAVAGGWLTDRFGSKRLLVIAGILGAIGSLLILLAHTVTALIWLGTVLGAGIGLFITANWSLANRLAPVEDSGKFLGLTNLATAGSAALGRLEGPLIDVLNNANPGAFMGYTALFVIGAIGALLSIVLLQKVQDPAETRPPQPVEMQDQSI